MANKLILNEEMISSIKNLYIEVKDIGRVAELLGFSYSLIRSKLHEYEVPISKPGAKIGNKNSLGYKQTENHKIKKNKYLDHTSQTQSKRASNKNIKYWKIPEYKSNMSTYAKERGNTDKFGFKNLLKDPIYYDKHCRQSMINATSRKSIKYSSSKAGVIFLKSNWELIVAKYLDKESEVKNFVYEPFSIDYISEDNKIRKYYPDFLVEYQLRKELLEIKPSFLLLEDVNNRKIKAASEFSIKSGISFKIITEKELDTYK